MTYLSKEVGLWVRVAMAMDQVLEELLYIIDIVILWFFPAGVWEHIEVMGRQTEVW